MLSSNPETLREAKRWVEALMQPQTNREILSAALVVDALDVAIADAEQPNDEWPRTAAERNDVRFDPRELDALLRVAASYAKAKVTERVAVSFRVERTADGSYGVSVVGFATADSGAQRERFLSAAVRAVPAEAFREAVIDSLVRDEQHNREVEARLRESDRG